MINLQRYAEAGSSSEDKNNEKKERRGEKSYLLGLIHSVSQSRNNEAFAGKTKTGLSPTTVTRRATVYDRLLPSRYNRSKKFSLSYPSGIYIFETVPSEC
jgi:hypothetical protein